MARVKLSEYRSKRLIHGTVYAGISITKRAARHRFKKGQYVVKVDQGIKRRLKNNCIILGVESARIPHALEKLRKRGYSRFLVEPFIPHALDTERYLSFERVQGGIQCLYARQGGTEIESSRAQVQSYLVTDPVSLLDVAHKTDLPLEVLTHLVSVFNQHHFSFLEINPFCIKNGALIMLDAAVLVDDAAFPFITGWTEEDIVEMRPLHVAEKEVQRLQRFSSASFRLRVLNPNGSLFLLLSGGGGSLVVADAISAKGAAPQMGNYGEYSGGPTRVETRLYAEAIINLALSSKAKNKALVITGAVANFTDVQETLAGISDAIRTTASQLRAARVRVFVRRGGPNEAVGLGRMKELLVKEKLYGLVYGSDMPLTAAIEGALNYVRT